MSKFINFKALIFGLTTITLITSFQSTAVSEPDTRDTDLRLLREVEQLKRGKLSLTDFLAKKCNNEARKNYAVTYLEQRVTGSYLISKNNNNYCYFYNLSKINFYVYEVNKNVSDSLWLLNVLSDANERNTFTGLEIAILKFLNSDYEKSLLALQRLSDAGIAEASYYLAIAYANGLGVEISQELSNKYLKIATDAGHFNSRFDTLKSQVDSNDPILQKRALEDLRALIQAGHVESIIFYSILHMSGKNVKKDIEKSIKLLLDVERDNSGEIEYYLGLAHVLSGQQSKGDAFMSESANRGFALAIEYLNELEKKFK